MSHIRRVGFIGIGNMGYPMAGHLARAGFELTVADTREDVVQRFLAEHRGKAAESLEALGRESEVVITMLPDGNIVRDVVFRNDGDCVVRGLRSGSIVIDMSTSNPVGTQSLAKDLEGKSIHMLDAPVAGGVVFAKDATLTVTVGGDTTTVERCRPLFEAIGKEIIHCGPNGAGHAMKALQNYVNAAAFISVLEAMVVGRRYGIPVNTMVEALENATTGRNAPLIKKVKPHVLTRQFATGMAMGLIAKDVKITVDAAQAVGAKADLAKCCFELWNAASETYGFTLDQSQVVRLWEDAAGVILEEQPFAK